MGYYSVNEAKLIRKFNKDNRTFEASVYCSELARWTTKEFLTIEEALEFIKKQLLQLSM